MLILTRCVSQSFIILPGPQLDPQTLASELFHRGPIAVSVTQVRGKCVRFSVVADRRLLILRQELHHDL